MLSKAIEGVTVRKEWTGSVLVVLIFGVRSDMTRIEFGLYCLAIGEVEMEEERLRITLKKA